MKQKFILFFSFAIICHASSNAQFKDGDFSIGLSANQITHTALGTKIGGGLAMQLFLNENVSLNSNLIFGPDYVHMPIGVALAGIVLLSGDPAGCSNISCNDNDYWAVLLMILFSEGMSFHIPVNDKICLSPYANPLGADYWYQPGIQNQNPFQFTFSAGTKFDVFIGENFNFAPYIEYKTIYGQGQPGFGIGITVNIKTNSN